MTQNAEQRNAAAMPLIEACREGDVERVRKLLDGGADGSRAVLRNAAGWAPIHSACFRKRTELVKLLIAAGADANSALYDGRTPLELAVGPGKWPEELVAALLPHVQPDWRVVQRMLDSGKGSAAVRLVALCPTFLDGFPPAEFAWYVLRGHDATAEECLLMLKYFVERCKFPEILQNIVVQIAKDTLFSSIPQTNEKRVFLTFEEYETYTAMHPKKINYIKQDILSMIEKYDYLKVAAVSYLLEAGAPVDDQLLPMCADFDYATLKRLLPLYLEKGLDINATDHGGNILLQRAARRGVHHTDKMWWLLHNGAERGNLF